MSVRRKKPRLWLLLSLVTAALTGHFSTGGEILDDTNNNQPSPICQSHHAFKLNDGHCIPMVGLGVAESDVHTYKSVKWALQDSGYRLVDTASHESYGNEDQVGQAVRDVVIKSTATQQDTNTTTKITRQDIFVTTKLWDDDHGFEDTIDAFEQSLENLGLDYIDLYLIHSPFGGNLVETWDALVFLKEQTQTKQLVKSIGVSNFGIRHLEAIRQGGTRAVPTINQFEIHPLLYQQRKPLLEYCQQHNIQVQAFGSLLYGSLQDWEQKEPLKTIMAKHPTKTSAQILLRWAIQHSIAVIPKSTNKRRIHDNIQVFDFALDDDDMRLLDEWGNTVSPEDRLMYKEEWDWNPVDEADVHEGDTDWFPDFHGYQDYFEDYEAHDHDVDKEQDEL
jgi:diketogulonate reductase-like aldo/keto reductase